MSPYGLVDSNLARTLIESELFGYEKGGIGDQFDSIRGPAVSPDGTRVALAGLRDGNTDVWVYDVTSMLSQ